MISVMYFTRFKVRRLRRLGSNWKFREHNKIRQSTVFLTVLKIKKY
jgi:hypothetical protein